MARGLESIPPNVYTGGMSLEILPFRSAAPRFGLWCDDASLKIAAYDEPVECDIMLETKDGKLSARRK